MNKITPFLWFDNDAAGAADFYVSVFNNSKVTSTTPMTVSFVLDGQQFYALNGGPGFKFNEAISLYVNCETQEEIDNLWDKLSAGGEKQKCGWLKDKYGLSWQIIPKILGEYLGDPDVQKAERVRQAMLNMTKIDITGLKLAYEK